MSAPLLENTSLLKTPWQGIQRALLWVLLLFCGAFLTLFLILFVGALVVGPRTHDPLASALVGALVGAILCVIVYFIVRSFTNWRRLRNLLIICACGATLIAVVYTEEAWRGKHDLQQFEQKWEAHGEKFDFASFIPPAVPDDQNFALTPIVFTTYGNVLTRDGQLVPYDKRDTNFVNRLEMPLTPHGSDEPTNGWGRWENGELTDFTPWQNFYRELAATTNVFPVSPNPQTPAQDVLLALSKYEPEIEELRQAARLTFSRFPLNYNAEPPAAILLPHLAPLKGVTRVLAFRSLAELQSGQSDKAFADIKLSLRVVDSIRTEPLIISQLVRAAMLHTTLQPIYEGLAQNKWSDAQLAELEEELAKLDFLADYEFSMRGERAAGISALEFIRKTRNLGYIETPGRLSFLMPSAFFYQNELTIARMHQQWMLRMVDVTNQIVSPETVRENDMAATNALNHFSPYNIFARILMPALGKAAKSFARAQSSADLARVAIALERYRLAHNAYPDSLDALAPQFMEKVPHDIIGGEPLHYRRTDNSFILYSVGWNARDDGGVTVQKKGGAPDWDRGDLVWKYPQ